MIVLAGIVIFGALLFVHGGSVISGFFGIMFHNPYVLYFIAFVVFLLIKTGLNFLTFSPKCPNSSCIWICICIFNFDLRFLNCIFLALCLYPLNEEVLTLTMRCNFIQFFVSSDIVK